MTCNDKCIHFPVCEMKKYDFANIDECIYYAENLVKDSQQIVKELVNEVRTIKILTYPTGEEYCIRCIPADILNKYIGGEKK